MGSSLSKSISSSPGFTWDSDAVLDQADVAIYAVDADGRCIQYNRAAERLLGYSREEALGQDMHVLVHSRYPDGTPFPESECPLLHARTASSTLTDIAEVLWTKAGEAVVVECSASPLRGSSEQNGAVITIKDVRDRHRTEERHRASLKEQAEALRQRDVTARIERELAEAEARWQRDLSLQVEQTAADQLRKQQDLISAVAEMAPVGIAVVDANLNYRWHNQSYRRFLNAREQTTAVGDDSAETRDGNDAEAGTAIVETLREVKRTGQPYMADEFKLTDPNGAPCFWSWSASRIGNDDLMIIALNVTEQVNARHEIESIYASAPIALALVDAKEFRYLRVNEEKAAILGLSPSEIVGKKVEDLGGLPEVLHLLRRAADGQAIKAEAISGSLPSERDVVRHWLLNIVPDRNDAGEIVSLGMAAIEITAQKRAEEALMHADKLASVGRLISSISHEINNPLEAVTNLLYLLQHEPNLSEQAAEYIRMAEGEIGRVSQIASQTLRFHRHAVGLVTRTPQQIVEPVVALYRGKLKNSHVQLETRYADAGPVICSEGDVRQILNNLVGNAIDAIGDGGNILIRTRTAHCARTGRAGTRISVSDSGHGMSEATAAHIFEPFYTTKGESGSGLGLWISHTLAERQGGTLQVRSCKEGSRKSGVSGTTFSLFLPHPEATGPGATVQ